MARRKKKVTVREVANSIGNQEFVFQLPNGRALVLEFCPHFLSPDDPASCVIATVLTEQGDKLPVKVNDTLGRNEVEMAQPHLWFATPMEMKHIREKVTESIVDTVL